ncbi:transposase [Microcystis aeruginosa]|uniref:transposase n=1 Tax=Microcystis aeruginosa TaxID=1126 RepID=UPI001EE98DA2|nr:transposase [Microcystis aeruginosa]
MLIWEISLLPINIERIALALDATTIGNKFVVLSINVLLAGCGIPIAWSIVKANQPGRWKPHWQKLIRQLKEAVPTGWTVIVPADRGLYAPWLYQVIVEAGWHPFLGINQQGLVKIFPHGRCQPLDALVSALGQSWSGQVVCFKTNPLACTLLARWDSGHQEPWLVLTDLSPQRADTLWYGLRPSTECVYRDLKSDGWQWQKTRLLDPQLNAFG